MNLSTRYYAKDITMHSFDNGISYKTKKDNWAQLAKVFKRLSFPPDLLSEEECNAIIACEDDAAMEFVCKLFELLTKRKVQGLVKRATSGRVAGYAQAISLSKVRSALKKNDLVKEDADRETVLKVSAATVEEHARSLRSERLEHPERFSVVPKQRVQASPKRPDEEEEEDETQKVRVTEIQVRQLDRNIAHLRASKHQQMSTFSLAEGSEGLRLSPQGGFGHSEFLGLDASALSGGGMAPENTISVLNACIARAMPPSAHSLWSREAEPIDNFLSALTLLKTDSRNVDSLVTEALHEMGQSASVLADACVVTPKQFWKVTDVFCASISLSPQKSRSFNAAVSGFSLLGRSICARDARAALLMFCDFALPKLREILATHPYKRFGAMQVFVAFQAQDISTRVQGIRRLQQSVPDSSSFIKCLAVLASQEHLTSDTLADLYCYYASIGLGMPSPQLRCSAVSILSTMLQHEEAKLLVYRQVPLLGQLAKYEQWWEVQVQLLSFCGAFMAAVGVYSPQSNAEAASMLEASIDQVLDMIRELLKPTATNFVKVWGLHALAASLRFGEPIATIFLDTIIGIEEEKRLFLLGFEDEGNSFTENKQRPLGLPSSTGIDYILEPLPPRWHAINLGKAIETTVRLNRLDRLLPEHVEVFSSCVNSALDSPDNELNGEWLDLYSALVDYLFVALCDPACVDNAIAIVLCFVYHSSLHEHVLQESRFIGALRLLYPVEGNGSVKCQTAVENFFQELFMTKGARRYDRAVTGILGQFWRSYPTQFERSNLNKLLNNFTNLMGK